MNQLESTFFGKKIWRKENKNKMNKKLEMLKGFWIYKIENKGNETYKQIDLVYDNQLIAIKK